MADLRLKMFITKKVTVFLKRDQLDKTKLLVANTGCTA